MTRWLVALALCCATALPAYADDDETYLPEEEDGYLRTMVQCRDAQLISEDIAVVTCALAFEPFHVVTFYTWPSLVLQPWVKSEISQSGAYVLPSCGPIRTDPVPGKETYQKWRCVNAQAFPVTVTVRVKVNNRP